MKRHLPLALALLLVSGIAAAAPIKALIIDGQNNHDWKSTTPVLKALLEKTGLFTVDVATSPPEGKDQSHFNPAFKDYNLVVLNYCGDLWNSATCEAFLDYVRSGGGVVVVHAADNAFGQWKEYNEIIGFGGWGGRNKDSGPYVFLKDGTLVHDTESDGPAGAHEGFARITVDNQLPEHPILKGMPARWFQEDELYNYMRGPGINMTVLATAYSGKPTDQGGSGRHEPMLATLTYGKGNIFHTALGHDARSMKCKGFELTFTRGAEWVATGSVTIPAPDDIPRPMLPHEAVGSLDVNDSYIPTAELVTELSALQNEPARLAEVDGVLIGYLENPKTPFLGLQATCNALGIAGSKAAVPALAALLAKDAQHASVARLALECIPGPEAAKVLLEELDNGRDFNQIGIINSLGRRRESRAVSHLAVLAKSHNVAVAGAAIDALGKIGTPEALDALQTIPSTPARTTALIVCANRLVAEGHSEQAGPVFGALVERTDLAIHNRTAALRGFLMVEPEQGMKHVWAMLRDEDQSLVALNVLGGVPGSKELAKDIMAHFDGLPETIQVSLISILGGMRQPVALPKALELAHGENIALKGAAIAALGQLPGNEASVSFLCSEALKADSDYKQEAHTALIATPGTAAEDIMINGIASGGNDTRMEYMKVAQGRALERACPVLLRTAADADPAIRNASFDALRSLAGHDEYQALIDLLLVAPEDTRDAAARAVLYAGRRINDTDKRTEPVVAAFTTAGDELRVTLIPTLRDISNAATLALVRDCANADNAGLRAAAVENLGKWKDPAAIDVALDLASSSNNPEQRAALMRSFGELLGRAGDVPSEKKLDQCKRAMDLGLDAKGKRALLTAVGSIMDGRALELLEKLGHDPELTDEVTRLAPQTDVETLGDRFITKWNVAGPFMNAGQDGTALFNTRFGPEMDAAMAVWQPLKAEVVQDGIVDLEKLFGGDNRVGYLIARLVAKKPVQATLSMGADDGIKAWLNGTLVHERMAVRPLGKDSDKVTVNLKKGENILLLKIVDVAGQWAACARILPK